METDHEFNLLQLAHFAGKRGWGIEGYLIACDKYRSNPEYWAKAGFVELEKEIIKH